MPQDIIRTAKKPQKVDLKRIGEIGTKLRKLIDQMSFIFPARTHLLQQILFALLTRQHVLIFGTYGTGKSDLVNTIFEAFEGCKIFSIELSKFLSESSIFGVPDPKKMREQGEVYYNPEYGILVADFAELDEFFDANDSLLRATLGVLNERHFKRGRQFEWAKLHSAIASTNGDPRATVKNKPELGAVVDRFLFQCRVGYVQTKEQRLRMYEKYLSGEKPSVKLTLEELKHISGIVVDANQIDDPEFLVVYDDVVEAYKAKMGTGILEISDRRRCRLLQICEANALLYGRYEVTFEDIYAVKWGLCTGGEQAHIDAFDSVAKPIIEKAVEARKQNIDELQVKLLAELKQQVPQLPQNPTSDDLVTTMKGCKDLRAKVADIKPLLQSTEQEKNRILAQIDKISASTLEKITA
ncbi:MAG: AAA family ATPase [Patescibacteria group bacterium]